jgi:large conductance mechanosensitive channel
MVEKEEKKSGFVKDFRAFITRGNMMDMAVGIIIGVAFGLVISSMVSDIIMPPVGLALGGADFKEQYIVLKPGAWGAIDGHHYTTLKNATDDGANTWRYGNFINTLLNFLIVALCVFVMIRQINKMKERAEAKKAAAPPTEKDCHKCMMKIPINATKCGHCTSDIGEA